MPHVKSIGLGGGSRVRISSDQTSVGPDSTGYQVVTQALSFGGDTLTATDIAVSAGQISIGTANPSLPASTITSAQERIKAMIETAIDSMKTSSADIPIYLVGGGAFLIPDRLKGVSRVYRPKFYDVANAVGAACALVAGSVDTFEETSTKSVGDVQKEVEARAIERAVAAGSDREKTTIVESECIPIACESYPYELFYR
jgi:N-methylhydantoinase A/oxoprolinase/acetone carboxylase beta subunit